MSRAGGFVAHLPRHISDRLAVGACLLDLFPICPLRAAKTPPAPRRSDDPSSCCPTGPSRSGSASARVNRPTSCACWPSVRGRPSCARPRQGCVPESHPQFVGVTGLGGHASTLAYMTHAQPRACARARHATGRRNFVLEPGHGAALRLHPRGRRSRGPRRRVSVGAHLRGARRRPRVPRRLLARLPTGHPRNSDSRPERLTLGPPAAGAVRPEALMAAIQDVVVDRHDAIVLAESGNSFIWASHGLRFDQLRALSPEHPRRIDGPCRQVRRGGGRERRKGRRHRRRRGDADEQRDQHGRQARRAGGVGRAQRRALQHV